MHIIPKLFGSPVTREILSGAAGGALPRLPLPPSDRDTLNMRREDQTQELLRLLGILQQESIVDPFTGNVVPHEQMQARAQAQANRLMSTVFTLYLDDVANQRKEAHV